MSISPLLGQLGPSIQLEGLAFALSCLFLSRKRNWGLAFLQGGPGAACAAGHMGQVENNKTMLVGGGTLQADTLATRSGGGVGVVDADVDAVARVDETVARGGATVDVAHKAIGGISVLYIG